MKDNKPIPIYPTVMDDFDDISGVIVKRSSRKRKRRRLLPRFLILFMIVGALYLGYKVFPTVKDYLADLSTQPSSMQDSSEPQMSDNELNNGTTDSTSNNGEGTDNSSTQESTAIDSPDEENSDFIHTSPDKFQFIDETYTSINPNNYEYSIHGISELYELFSKDAPIVLITSFSPLEGYFSADGSFYSETDNVSKIGEVLCKELNEMGVNAVHYKPILTDGTRYEMQKEYVAEINEYLKANPSITYILDISRSVNINENMQFSDETVNINDKSYHTVSLICGTNNSSLTEGQKRGIYFAYALSQHCATDYPLFVSKQTVSKYNLSQVFEPIALRVDIGSYASSFTEATQSALLFARCLADFLNNN